jgi:hypothetical protein
MRCLKSKANCDLSILKACDNDSGTYIIMLERDQRPIDTTSLSVILSLQVKSEIQGDNRDSLFRIFRHHCLYPHLQQAEVPWCAIDGRQVRPVLSQICLMKHEGIMMQRNDIVYICSLLNL